MKMEKAQQAFRETVEYFQWEPEGKKVSPVEIHPFNFVVHLFSVINFILNPSNHQGMKNDIANEAWNILVVTSLVCHARVC